MYREISIYFINYTKNGLIIMVTGLSFFLDGWKCKLPEDVQSMGLEGILGYGSE